MLIQLSYDVEKSLTITLYNELFTKKFTVSENDIIEVSYNKNGLVKTVKGKVTKVYTDGSHKHPQHVNYCGEYKNEGCYIVVDSSVVQGSDVVKIDVDMILDMDMIQKYSEGENITSPMGEGHVTNFRVVENELQVSTNYGNTWRVVGQLGEEVISGYPSDYTLPEKIAAVLPPYMRNSEKKSLVNDLLRLFESEMSSDDPEYSE